jgi:hypothetical protein
MKLVILFLLVSCVWEATEKEKEVLVGRWGNVEYDKHLSDALDLYGQDLMKAKPIDCAEFNCIQDTKKFWFNVITEIARWESGYKAETSYKESFKDQKGEYVYSRGLLQLSIESGKGYGCPFKVAQDVHDPKLNLECGVRILNRWVVRDNRIAGKDGDQWKGGARYWSVLRGVSDRGKKALAAIKEINKGAL